jgi:hypothetical protein
MQNSKSKLSIRRLAQQTGADRASIAKWIEGVTDEAQALIIIAEHQRKAKPGKRMSWFQRKAKEDARRLTRENEEAEAVQSKRWTKTDDVCAILRAVVARMEQWPCKVRSEGGLNDTQTAVLQKCLDDLRTQIASDILALGQKGEAA